VTGRHAGRVDDAEGAVWAEGIRARALTLANELGQRMESEATLQELEAGLPSCGSCLSCRTLEFLREIAGTP
jgi:hypothetical protein